MSDFAIFCVTNRRLCREDFLCRMEKIAAARPAAVILREKDLAEEDYAKLAAEVLGLCRSHGVPCILHSFSQAAKALGAEALHLPLPLLRRMPQGQREQFAVLGASCHSAAEAREAEALGCTYITAGHVFDTDCKKGLPGRGLPFLEEVCGSVSIPVYAIGGIHEDNVAAVRRSGAQGACVMSALMQCQDPAACLQSLRQRAARSFM